MKKQNTALLVLSLGIISFSMIGCATITGGTRTNAMFKTNPEGATVSVGTVQCKTPCQMSVSRKAHQVQVNKAGYETLNLELDKGFRGVPTILGNIFWLPVGLVVDFVAGGAYDVEPVDVALAAKSGK